MAPQDQLRPAAALARARAILGDSLVDSRLQREQLVLRVAANQLVAVAQKLQGDPELACRHLSLVTGIDYLNAMDALYVLRSVKHPVPVIIEVALDRDSPLVPSLCALWHTANWHEREAYDMLGIVFEGHPDLRRILNREDFDQFPYRKDAEPKRVLRPEWQWPGGEKAVRLPGEPPREQRS